jgi:hypothetical protein
MSRSIRKIRARTKRRTSKYRIFRISSLSWAISNLRRTFVLLVQELSPHTYTIIMAECGYKDLSSDYMNFKEEIYTTNIYDRNLDNIVSIVEGMCADLAKGQVDFDDPLAFALNYGGTIKGRTPISTPMVGKHMIN